MKIRARTRAVCIICNGTICTARENCGIARSSADRHPRPEQKGCELVSCHLFGGEVYLYMSLVLYQQKNTHINVNSHKRVRQIQTRGTPQNNPRQLTVTPSQLTTINRRVIYSQPTHTTKKEPPWGSHHRCSPPVLIIMGRPPKIEEN